MAVATFDTLKFANTLKSAGVPDKQAEAQAVAFAEVIQINMKDLATKEDLKLAVTEIEQKLTTRFDSLNNKIDNNFEKNKGEMNLLRWMLGVGLIGTLSLIIRSFIFRGAI
jgi:G3E family GTPase